MTADVPSGQVVGIPEFKCNQAQYKNKNQFSSVTKYDYFSNIVENSLALQEIELPFSSLSRTGCLSVAR